MSDAADRPRHPSREGAAPLELILGQMPVITWAVDRDLRFTHSAGSGLEKLGLREGEIEGTTLFEFFRTQDATFEPIAKALRAVRGEHCSYECTWEGRAFEVHLAPLRDGDEVTGCIGVALDVTERLAAEETSRRLLENMVEGVYRATPAGRLLLANPALARMLGYGSADELLGMDCRELLVDPALRAAWAERLERDGEERGVEVRLRRRDGGEVVALESASVVRDPSGRAQWIEGTLTDITLRVQLEERLAMTQRLDAVGRLASGVAHDFNNLLTAITGSCVMAQHELPPDHPAREQLNHAIDAGQRAAALVRRLLAIGRQEAGSPVLLDLDGLVRQVAPLLQRLAGEEVELALDLHAEPARILADPVQVEQVLLNLVVNARNAMPYGGRLALSTRRAAAAADGAGTTLLPHVELDVADTGIGMDEETRARMFEPFFSRGRANGTGLGLTSVQSILRSSSAHVVVDSAPGAGTTFHVRFPEAGAGAAPTAEPRACETGARVLVVEDDADLLHLATSVLRREGLRVGACASPEEALRRVEEGERVDLLVSDVMLPGMSGPGLASRLRRLWPELPVLLVTGCTEHPDFRREVAQRATPFLEKPFSPRQLLDAVRGALAARRATAVDP